MNASIKVRFERSIANGRRHSFRYGNLFAYSTTNPQPGAYTPMTTVTGGDKVYGPFEVNSRGAKLCAPLLQGELL